MSARQFKWIPNFLSTLRLGVALVFPFLPSNLRLPFVALALITEYLDGALARRYSWVTLTGQYLDPIADKVFALSVTVTLLMAGQLMLWQVVVISFRDLTVGLGLFYFIVLLKKKISPERLLPNFFGKLTTVFQYLVFASVLLLNRSASGLILVTGLISLVASMTYIFAFLSSMPHVLKRA